MENRRYLVILFSMEIFVSTRQQFYPDPEFDSVTAIFYAVWHDGPKQNSYGVIATDPNVVFITYAMFFYVAIPCKVFWHY